MGRLFVASVLMSLHAKPANRTTGPEPELEPMVPGAWAAWARSWENRQAETPTSTETRPAPAPILRPEPTEA